MSRTIEERVVTLQFDNAEFEKNIKHSMSSLDKLEKSLKFKDADEGFKKVNDAAAKTDFNPLIKAQVTVTEGFSAMERVAINVLSSIAIRAEQAGERLVRSLTVDQVSTGWNKYNEKIASVQTLANSTGKSLDEINDALDKLMWFSDETSYGFNDMTKSLAQLTSSGGKVENLMPMIMGIANATAFAGKSTQEFSRAIYNLNQSYGAGALKYMDWKSLELAGVATKDLKQAFIDTAIELGRLNEFGETSKGTLVELGTFGETLKEGWADTSVMEATFGKFYQYTEMAYQMIQEGQADSAADAYAKLSKMYDDIYIKAARSAQEAKTFGEAIEATKDAVSTKWMKTFDTVFGNYDQAKETWTNMANDFWEIFASGGDIRNDILSSAFNDDYTQLKNLFTRAGADFGGFSEEFEDFLVRCGYDVGSLIKEYGTLSNAISHNADILEIESDQYYNLGERLKSYIKISKLNLTEYVSSTKDVEKITENLQVLFDNVWLGTYGNGEERVRKLTEANIDYATTQQLINKLAREGHRAGYKLLADDIAHLTDEELKNMGITREQAYVISEALQDVSDEAKSAQADLEVLLTKMGRKSGQVLLSKTFSNITGSLIALQDAAREAWSTIFSDVNFGDIIYNALERVERFTDGVKTAIEESELLRTVLQGFFTVIKLVGKGFSIVYEVVRQFISGGLKILSSLFKDVNIDVENFSSTVGEALDKALEWLQTNEPIIGLIETAAGGVAKAIENVQKWISSFAEVEEVTNVVSNIQNGFENFLGNDYGLTSLTKTYENLVNTIKSSPKDAFKNVGENVKTFFEGFATSIGTFKTSAIDGITETFRKLKWSEEEIQKFQDIFKKTTETLLGIGGGYMFLNIFTKLATAIESLAAPFATVSDLIKSVKGVFTSISGYINAQKNNMTIQNILKIAVAVGILAASMYALAKVGKTGDLWTAIGATAALLGIISLFALAIALIGKINTSGDGKKAAVNLKELALVILSFGASMLMIAGAMKSLDGVEHFIRDMIVIVVAMIALVWAVNKVSDKKMVISSIFDMIGIALAIKLLVAAVADLDKLKLKNPWAVIIELIGIIGAMVAVSWALKGVNRSSSLVLLAFASSIAAFVKTLKAFAAMDSKVYLNGLLKMAPIIAALMGITYLLGKIPEKSFSQAAIYLVGMAVSLLLVGNAIKKLGALDAGQLVKGGVAALTLFGIIGVIGAGVSRIAFVKGATIKAAIGSALVIISMAASLYLMAGAILIFKNMDPEGLKTAVKVIAAIFGAIGAVMYLIGKGGLFGEKSQALQAVAALGKIALIIGVLAASLAVLSFLPTDKLIVAASSITAVIIALGALTWVLQKYKVDDMLVAFGTVTLVLIAVGAVLFALTSLTQDTNKALAIAEALSKVLVALGEMFVMSAVANLIVAASGTMIGLLPALKTIGLVIGGLAALIAIIEAAFPGSTDYILGLLDKVGAIVTKVGELFGSFVGTTIGAIGSSFTAELLIAAENLSKFADSISNFVSLTIPDSFDSTLASIGILLTTLGPQAGNIRQLASLGDVSVGLSKFFTEYGASMAILSNSMNTVNVPRLEAAAAVGTMFAALNESLGPNKISAFFTGKQTLDSFTSNLENFGNGLVAFSKSMLDFKDGYVLSALPTIERLINLEGNLQNGWSLVGWLAGGEGGNKSLGDFGERAKKFGKGLADMSDELAEFNPDAVTAAVTAGEALTALEQGLTNSWSLVGWLGLGEDGNQSLGDFGNRIQEFAAGLVNGLNAFATLSTAVIETAPSEDFVGPMNKTATNFEKVEENVDWIVSIGEKFAELENSLGESASFIGSTSKLKSFGDGLGAFSIGFKTFTENIPENLPDETMVGNMIGLIKQFVQFTGTEGIGTDAGTALTSIGKGLGSMIDGFKSSLDTLFSSESFESAGGEEGVSSSGWLSTISDKVANLFSNEETTEKIENGANDAGKAYLTSLDGVFTKSDALTKLQKTLDVTVNSIVDKFKYDDHEGHKTSYQGVFAQIGKNYMQGLIDGLKEMEGALYDKARSIASNVSSIFASMWDEHSPSRVAFGLGRYFTMGLANGIDDLSDTAIENAQNMAISVRNAVVDAMVVSDQMLENALDPVITPVLDTANVINGANVISGLLASGASYNAALSVEGARNARLMADNQNGGKGALISMNNTFEINGISNISDPQLVNEMADKLYKRINYLLGSAI